MGLTLDDIMAAPTDPDELNKHLLTRGLIPPPPPPETPAPLVPAGAVSRPMVKPAPEVSNFTPPEITGMPGGDVHPEMTMGGTPAPINPARGPKLVKPMSAPFGVANRPIIPGAEKTDVGAAPEIGTPAAPTDLGGEMQTGALPTLRPPTKKESIEAGKEEYQRDRPTITSTDPTSSEYHKEKLAQSAWDAAHPWGSDVSAHPGTLGKIGHVAGLIGQIAGSAVMPGVVESIPGTRLNRLVTDRENLADYQKAKTREEEAPLRQAQTEEAQAGTAEKKASTAEKEKQTSMIGQPNTDEAKTIHDLMTGGENGGPKINPKTQQPYNYLEAYGDTKHAGEKTPEAEKPLDPKNIDQLNGALQERYQVLNPGKALPPAFQIKPGMTQGDYDRLDKTLESTEKSTLTKTQIDALNEQKRLAREDKDQAKQDKEEKEGRDWVTGEDPTTGAQVMVPLSQAKDLGLKNQAKADNDTLNKTLAARHVEPLLYSNDAANPGIMQMIDKLDKEGKLGPLASRWNDFMARKYGADDPEYAALRARMDLATTKLMQAHVGSRGGAFMLEHFEDIANAKRMSAANLRAGIDQEIRYVHDISMSPPKTKPAAAQPAKPAAGGAAPQYKVGQVVDGYTFKGGDSKKKENWEKVKKP